MNIRKAVRESIESNLNQISNDDAKNILKDLIGSIEKSGIKIVMKEILFDINLIVIYFESKDKGFQYGVSLDIDFEITKPSYREEGRIGSTDTAVAPYYESPEWKMYLKEGNIYDEKTFIYFGKSVFDDFFKKIYRTIYSVFDQYIADKY